MYSFKYYITEVAKPLRAFGREAARDTAKYITPYIENGQVGTHTIASKAPGLNVGDNVTIHSHHVNDRGVHHIVVSKPGSSEKITIPTSKIRKVGTTTANKGHQAEDAFHERMEKWGLTPPGSKPAGSTAGSDVRIINKRQKRTHLARDVTSQANELNGEVKKDTGAAFGQITIKHDPSKGGWHIPDDAREKRPKFAAAIEQAGIIDRMNKHVPDPDKAPTTLSGRAQTITISHPDLKPADAYLQDHNVHFLHVASHGTFSVGGRDVTGHGLPPLTGQGAFDVRDKHRNGTRTIQFRPMDSGGLIKSHVNLNNDDHLDAFAKTLGYGDAPARTTNNETPPSPAAKPAAAKPAAAKRAVMKRV